MPMRTDCRHYESRTYRSGEVVRKCRLDLAPEAPWRCPDDCQGYERRRIDVGWNYGSLRTVGAAPAPEPAGDEVAALLDQAEEIVNTAAPEIISEVDAARARKPGLLRGLRKKAGKQGKKRKKKK